MEITDIIFIMILIVVPVKVGIDANKRETNTAGWVLIALFFSYLGLLIYLSQRKKYPLKTGQKDLFGQESNSTKSSGNYDDKYSKI
ncbi:MAG: PLD nuclease N-terminal domain-containing protein [Bacteroidales bacterium]|nr:PLD nuclease N-terminal domain-containing protein [Bacteroidales bacterium]MCF8390601.1 PLD nuclease N-terminal domain-containing protein [Bacteroidales bacterium]